jgi:hypothetical protein
MTIGKEFEAQANETFVPDVDLQAHLCGPQEESACAIAIAHEDDFARPTDLNLA